MGIIQISIVAIVTTILAATIKSQKPEFAIMLSLVAGTLIMTVSSGYLKYVFQLLKDISDKIDLDLSFFEIILKVVAISYICEFSSQVCRDAGEAAIAVKVELAGKILVLFMSTPIISALLELLTKII